MAKPSVFGATHRAAQPLLQLTTMAQLRRSLRLTLLAGLCLAGCSNVCGLGDEESVTTCDPSGSATIVDRSTGLSVPATTTSAEQTGATSTCTAVHIDLASSLTNCSITVPLPNDCLSSSTITLQRKDAVCDEATLVSGVVTFVPEGTLAFHASFSLTIGAADGHEHDVSDGTASQSSCHASQECTPTTY